MSKSDEQFSQDDGERAFAESVKRFADAFFALTEEERNELEEYVEGLCKQAEEEYKNRTGKK